MNPQKSIENRVFPFRRKPPPPTNERHRPKKYEGVELALIETPGKVGRFKSRIIGTITFSHSFKYPDKQSWVDDYNRHKVEENDDLFKWNDNKSKYGWVVCSVKKFNIPIDVTKRKGIIFTEGCRIK